MGGKSRVFNIPNKFKTDPSPPLQAANRIYQSLSNISTNHQPPEDPTQGLFQSTPPQDPQHQQPFVPQVHDTDDDDDACVIFEDESHFNGAAPPFLEVKTEGAESSQAQQQQSPRVEVQHQEPTMITLDDDEDEGCTGQAEERSIVDLKPDIG